MSNSSVESEILTDTSSIPSTDGHSTSDPLSTPESTLATVHPISSLPDDDPFANATFDVALTKKPLSPSSFQRFPKPKSPKYENQVKMKKGTKKKKASATSSTASITSILSSSSSTSISNTSLVFPQSPTSLAPADESLLPDSQDHIKHLEERLERLKKRQEQREKQMKNKKTTEFNIITTSAALNGTDVRSKNVQVVDKETLVAVHSSQDKDGKTAAANHHMRMADEDEFKSIMPSLSSTDEVPEPGKLLDVGLMPSSDGTSVGSVQDKHEEYANIVDERCTCC